MEEGAELPPKPAEPDVGGETHLHWEEKGGPKWRKSGEESCSGPINEEEEGEEEESEDIKSTSNGDK